MFASAQVEMILGEWRTVDDVTGETKGIVEFYQGDNGLYYGKIIKVFWKGQELKDTGFENMVVIKDMEAADGMLKNGIIYEPEGKKNYYGKIYYNKGDNTITLRGSLDKFRCCSLDHRLFPHLTILYVVILKIFHFSDKKIILFL